MWSMYNKSNQYMEIPIQLQPKLWKASYNILQYAD